MSTQSERGGEYPTGRIAEPHGVYFDRSASPHNVYGTSVVELHLSFGGKAQVSAHPDNTGFLIRVFSPGAPHDEGGDNHTDLSVSIRYDEGLRPVVEAVHLTPRSARPEDGTDG